MSSENVEHLPDACMDQDAVAKAIAGDKEDPEKAGEDWVTQNADKVEAWLN